MQSACTHSPGSLVVTTVEGTVGTPQVCFGTGTAGATDELMGQGHADTYSDSTVGVSHELLLFNPLTPVVSKSYLVSPYAYGNLYGGLILGVTL